MAVPLRPERHWLGKVHRYDWALTVAGTDGALLPAGSAPQNTEELVLPQAFPSHGPAAAAAASSGSPASLLKGQHTSQQGRSLHLCLSGCEWDALTTDS